LTNRRRIYVFNKIDLAKDIDKKLLQQEYEQFSPVFISATKKEGLEDLAHTIVQQLSA
jgi:50S ribosomal subunit-associated GTPase HflX